MRRDRQAIREGGRSVRLYHASNGLVPREARQALVAKHYLKRLPPISHTFTAWTDEGDLFAVVTFGVPPSRHLQISACPSRPDLVLELNRMWIDDKMPRNTASALLAQVFGKLPARIIVSYADTAAGHDGYVYRACNFFYAGLTDADRKTPRFDYVPHNGKHSRDAFRSGEYERVRRVPKHKYWTITGNKRERRELLKIAGWPRLSWKQPQQQGQAA